MTRTTQILFAAVIVLIGYSVSAIAADVNVAEQYSEKPIGITWDTNITQTGSMLYVQQLAEDHDIDLPWMQNDEVETYQESQKEIDNAEAKGNIFFLKKGFIPSFVQVGFRLSLIHI